MRKATLRQIPSERDHYRLLVDEGTGVDEFLGIEHIGLLGHVLVHVGVEFADSLESQFAASLKVDVFVDLLEFLELLRREFIETQ